MAYSHLIRQLNFLWIFKTILDKLVEFMHDLNLKLNGFVLAKTLIRQFFPQIAGVKILDASQLENHRLLEFCCLFFNSVRLDLFVFAGNSQTRCSLQNHDGIMCIFQVLLLFDHLNLKLLCLNFLWLALPLFSNFQFFKF